MSQGSSQVSSGNIAPTIKGPEKEAKEVMLSGGLILFIVGLLAAAWLYSHSSDQGKAMGNIEPTSVPDLLKKATVLSQVEAPTTYPTQVTAPAVSAPDIIHADIYFEIGRKGLTDEGKAQLSAQAAILGQHEEYGVLIQGYTDQQGPASYNKQLGMKRAGTVKTELVNAGIAEHRIKTVSLGEEGVLCVDNSDVCRHMNRRVHLEVRKIGQEHMMLPLVPATTSESSDSPVDPPSTTEDTSSPTDEVPPAPSDPTTMLEPASGS